MAEGITIDQLRTLRAVAEEGSFSAAARKLGHVQAAVSQSIQRLEAELGVRIFDRSARVPRLTEHGEAIAAAAARIQGEVDGLDALVARLKSGDETKLSIVVDAMFPAEALVAFAREFVVAHPAVELSLNTEMLSEVAAFVRDRRATLGIAGTDTDLTDLDYHHVTEVRLVPVVAPTHPLAAIDGSIDAAALARVIQVVLSERPGAKHPTADRGVLSARTWRVVDLMTKHAFLVAGLGWGHMPEHLVRADLASGRLRALRLDEWEAALPSRSLSLVRRKGVSTGPVATWAAARLTALCRLAVTQLPPHTA